MHLVRLYNPKTITMAHYSTQAIRALVIAITAIYLLSSCTTSKQSLAVKGEAVNMEVYESPNVLDYAILERQKIPTLADRLETSRGIPISMLGGAVSLATQLIKQVIAKDREKYVQEYSVGLTDMYFYDQLSTESAFDPIGMQFQGFTVIRTFTNDEGKQDTALRVKFGVDTRLPYEIINNSIFRLRVEEFQLNYTKVKMTNAQKKTINMDFEIVFNTSYVNEQGDLFKDVELGRFYLLLRGMPVDQSLPNRTSYYTDLNGKLLDGKSFIVPRSFGYYVSGTGKTGKSYSQGAYSVTVNIKESALDKFVTKVIADNSDKLLDLLEDKAKEKLK